MEFVKRILGEVHRFCHLIRFLWKGHRSVTVCDPDDGVYVITCTCRRVFYGTPDYEDSTAWASFHVFMDDRAP